MNKRRNEPKLIAIHFRSLALISMLPCLAGAGPFRYGEDRAPSTLNPAYSTSMVDTRMEELLFEGLFSFDRFLNPVPVLAATHEVSEDRTQTTVFLKSGFWHDGKPITPQDVAFTVEALKHPKTRSAARSSVALIDKVEVKGPTELLFTFTQSLVQPERALMFKVLPKHKFPKGAPLKPRDAFRMNPVGSGPFKFLGWEGTTIELESDHHHKVGIGKMQARFIPDKKVQLDFLQYDALEAVVRVLPNHRPVIEGMSGKVELLPYESLTWWYIGINQKNAHLSKTEVRRALVHALDRNGIRKAHLGDGRTISGPFAPRSPFYNDEVKAYRHDMPRTKQLLKKAGYRKSGRVYKRRNAKLALRLAVNKDWSVYKDVVLDIQTRLGQAGFDITIDWLDPATFRERVVQKKDFDLTIGAWSFDEASNVYELFHSNGRKNFFNYKSERMDALLDQSKTTRDPELFREIYRRVHEQAHNDLPYAFLWSVHSYTAVTAKVIGVDIHPFRYFTWIGDWKWKKD